MIASANTHTAVKFDERSFFLENIPTKRSRIWELDFIRGFCVLLMIVDHLMYLLAFTYGNEWFGWHPVAGSSFGADLTLFARWYWNSTPREIIHPIILFLFFSVSGISCYFSRSNLKRGLQLAVISIIYSLATLYLQNDLGMNGSLVSFGVLNMLATCILSFTAVSFIIKLATKGKAYGKWICSAVFFSIFLVIVLLYFLYIPPKTTPKWLFFLFPPETFFTQAEMSPGDFFPMIPWASFFFFGAMIAPLLYGRKKSLFPSLDRGWHRPVSFLGKYTLVIYLTHIILLTLLFSLISFLFVTPGDWIIF